jgi:hypothetical protein
MKYTRPELDYVRFTNVDILTDSDELPIIPAEAEDELESFDAAEGE